MLDDPEISRTAMEFLKKPDSFAVGVGRKTVNGIRTGDTSLVFFVRRKLPKSALSAQDAIAGTVNSGGNQVPTDVQEMDEPFAPMIVPATRPAPAAKATALKAERPGAIMGESGANMNCPAGTLGIFVRPENSPAGAYRNFLSCNHVLANFGITAPYAPILQPSFIGGGRWPANWIGSLAEFAPIDFRMDALNSIDAAVGYFPSPVIENIVFGIGAVGGLLRRAQIQPDLHVRKFGAGSGLTEGNVIAFPTFLKINYAPLGGGVALYRDQIVADCPACYGDSGSVIFDNENFAVGHIFGGALTHSFCNPMEDTLAYFGMSL
jgi:hypothetical protein